jgi:diguanylate cyclase (GGDEF)-like protein
VLAVSTTAVIAVLAFSAAAVLVTIAVVRRLSPAPRESDHLVKAVDEMRMKMDELSQDLSHALERAERESRRNRLFGELGGSIDLPELLDRVLDAALEIEGFDAAMISVEGPGVAPVVVTRAMTPEEAAKPPTSGVAGALPGTITVTYRYGREREVEDTGRIGGGVFIPLIGRDLAPIGTLSLFWRDPDFEPGHDRIELAEALAESSIPAIENARRYGEARKLAETDALTGLYNQRYFHETLRREVLRAQRYDRNLALMVFDVDDFKGINDKIGHLAGDRVLAQAADRLRDAVRSVDIACRIGGDEFAVILPESRAGDADQLYRRLQSSMRGTALGPDHDRLRISAGIAELQHGDTAAGLFERADAALYRAKDQGKDRADISRVVDRPPSE